MISGYQFKNIKSARGHEGESCAYGDLYKGTKKVCTFAEDTWGGPIQVNFVNDAALQDFLPAAREYLSSTPDAFGELYDLSKMNDFGIAETAVENLSHAAVEDKEMRRLCKNAVVVRALARAGAAVEIITAKCLYTEQNVAEISAKVKGVIEVVNRRYGEPLKEGTPEHRQAQREFYKKKLQVQTLFVRLIDGKESLFFFSKAYSLDVAKALRSKHADLLYILNEGA